MKRSAALAISLSVAVLTCGTAARASAADDQFATVQHTDYTYQVDVAQRVVHVTASLRVVNDGSYGDRVCLERFQLRFPVGASNTRVMDRIVPLDHEIVAPLTGAAETLLRVDLQECLQYGRQDGLLITYDLPAGAPRSSAPARITDEAVGFVAWGAGRAGGSSIVVELPKDFTADSLTDGWTATEQGSTTIYTKGPIKDPTTFAVVVAHAGTGSTSTVTVGDHDFILVAQPGDDEWTSWASEQLPGAVQALEQAIGVPWPTGEAMTIRETYSPGTADAVVWPTPAATAPVSEELDELSLRRGLAVAWFGSDHLADSWVADALADSFAGVQPQDGSAAAAIDEIRASLGDEVMAAVVGDIMTGTSAYGITATEPVTWRQLLDLLEERGTSTSVQDLLTPFVDVAEGAPLDERPAARDAYVALRDRAADLVPPLGVRTAMNDWDFALATELIAAADETLDGIDELRAALDGTGIDVPEAIVTAYTDATSTDDLEELAATVRQQSTVADELARAVAAERSTGGAIDTIGLIASDLDERLADAKKAFAAGEPDAARTSAFRAITEANSATFEGVKRLVLAWGLILASLVVALTVRDVRRILRARQAPVAA